MRFSLPPLTNRAYRLLAIVAFLLAATAFLLAVAPADGPLAALGLRLKLRDAPIEENAIYYAETQYQILTVTAETGNPSHRAFYQDKLRHSEIDLSDISDIKYPYMRIYDALLHLHAGPPPAPLRLLLLGGGGYVFPNILFRQRPGSEIVVVEIDPGVTRAAQLAFGFPTNAPVEIHHMDARNYVSSALRLNATSPGTVPLFDIIVCDSVSDYSVPYQLTTREFMTQVRSLLKPNGLYIMNLIDSFQPGAFMNAIAQTFADVFPYRAAITCATDPAARDTTVFIGATDPIDLSSLPAHAARPDTFKVTPLSNAQFDDLLQRNGTCILTDDFAPVENLLAPVVRADPLGRMAGPMQAGLRAVAKQDYPRAVLHFKKALEAAPGAEPILDNLAHAQELAGDPHGALDTYAALVQLYPLNVTARNRAAMILAQQGHIGPALEQWGESLRINPAQPDILNNLGALAMQQGQRDKAIAYWRRALEFAPGAPILLKNLAAAGETP